MLRDQWKQLVLKPVERVGVALDVPLVLVIDALDECQDAVEIDVVLQLLCEMASSLLVCYRLVFLTSRPEISVRMGLTGTAQTRHRHIVLHHVDPSVVDRDIEIYLKHTLGIIRRQSCLGLGWPPLDSIERLVQRAGGLFI